MNDRIHQEYVNASYHRKMFSLTWINWSDHLTITKQTWPGDEQQSLRINETKQSGVLELHFFLPSLPLHQSESPYLGCPSSFDVAAISKGTFVLWADRRSTPLIPIYAGWMEKTEDSTAYGSNRSASLLLWSLSSHFFIEEEGKGGAERKWGQKRNKVLVFPWEWSLRVKYALVNLFSFVLHGFLKLQ